MALKAGSLVSTSGTVLIERLQSGGPGTLNIPSERVYELGNYTSVGTTYDTPELTFSLESYDVSLDTERMLTGQTEADVIANGIDLATVKPINIAQNLKPGKKMPNPFVAVAGVAIPYLALESASYKFGVRDNATETFSLRGDSIYYCPGRVFIDTFVGTGTANQAVVTTHPAYPYVDTNGTRRVLAVQVGLERLTEGADYTVSYGTVTDDAAVATVTVLKATTAKIELIYHSPDPVTYPQSIHSTPSLKPAAVKGRDVSIYLGGYDPADPSSSAGVKFTGVQDLSIDWRVTLEDEREMGNPNAVGRDFDVPTVSGSVTIQPRTVDDLLAKLRTITGVANAKEAIGPDLAVPLPLDVIIKDPETGVTLKRFHVDDARFSVPGYAPRVQQNISMSLEWSSDSGDMRIFRDLAAPAVTDIEPATGTTTGGASVVIAGTNFVGVTAVKFGTTAATSFVVDNHRQITAVAPAHAAGTVDVVVTTSEGDSAPVDASKFIYA